MKTPCDGMNTSAILVIPLSSSSRVARLRVARDDKRSCIWADLRFGWILKVVIPSLKLNTCHPERARGSGATKRERGTATVIAAPCSLKAFSSECGNL